MVQNLFDKNIFMYIMIGLCIFGILLKVMLNIEYTKLMKASDNMGTAKNKLTQTMKKKFETCYKLKIGVNNVDIFVDKYVYKHRFCGILLSTWESIGGQVLMLCLLIGSLTSILGLIYDCGKREVLSTFSVGIITSGLLIFLESMINFTGKKELIRINMKDYLENFFKVRLEQELLHPELIEQYKKDLSIQEDGTLVMENTQVTAEDLLYSDNKKLSRTQKKEAKRKAKEAKLQEKSRYKAEVKSEKEQAKEQAKEAKINAAREKKEEKEVLKLKKRETRERIEREAKLAAEQKKEQERALKEEKIAQAKLEKENKKAEKNRQEEIKHALLLEKQAAKAEKQNHGEQKTIAQEKKEILMKEIKQRRASEGQDTEGVSETEIDEKETVFAAKSEDMKVTHKKTREAGTGNVTLSKAEKVSEKAVEKAEDKVSQKALEKAVEKDSEKAAEKIVDKVSEKVTESVRPQLRLNKNKKQSEESEEKLIEDILKEFLA